MTEYHRPRKRFGQNFLHDKQVINKLVTAIAPKSTDLMVEIGPGQGALTGPLLEKLDTLHAVELDRDLVERLEQLPTGDKLVIHSADALKFDFSQLADHRPMRIVGNLPYNISTPLLFHLLGYRELITDMYFMLQLEVVDRLAASPGNKTYGRLSVMAQYFCQVDKLFSVPRGAFYPPPKVTSAIVRLQPRVLPVSTDNQSLFEQVVRLAFSQRRKTLRNNLKQLLQGPQLDQLDYDLGRRPEQLDVDEYVKLSNAINSLLEHGESVKVAW